MPRGQALGTPGANASGMFSVADTQGDEALEGVEALEKKLEALETLLPGAWTPLAEGSSAVEKSTVEARTENGVIRIRGRFVAKENFTAEKLLFTLPVALRPSATRWPNACNASTGGAAVLQVEANGEIKWKSGEAVKGSVIALDTSFAV
jgi:hypothetical protein